jgi:AcrR family transcriptional regulator
MFISVGDMSMRAKPVSQQRSQEKRDQILQAMDSLLRRKSFGKVSVSELARKADVSPATIYQRFSNLDATGSVLLELYYLQVERWSTRTSKNSAVPELPLFDALLALASNAFDQIAELGHVMGPAYLYSRQYPDRVGTEWSRIETLAIAGFTGFLQARSKEIRVKELAEAARLLCYFFNFMMLGPLLHGRDSPWKNVNSHKAFTHDLATMAYRYLTHPDGPGRK